MVNILSLSMIILMVFIMIKMACNIIIEIIIRGYIKSFRTGNLSSQLLISLSILMILTILELTMKIYNEITRLQEIFFYRLQEKIKNRKLMIDRKIERIKLEAKVNIQKERKNLKT